MDKIEYWLESLSCSLEEMGAENSLTDEQKKSIACDMSASHENYSMAFGQPDFRPSKTQKSPEVKKLEEKFYVWSPTLMPTRVELQSAGEFQKKMCI